MRPSQAHGHRAAGGHDGQTFAGGGGEEAEELALDGGLEAVGGVEDEGRARELEVGERVGERVRERAVGCVRRSGWVHSLGVRVRVTGGLGDASAGQLAQGADEGPCEVDLGDLGDREADRRRPSDSFPVVGEDGLAVASWRQDDDHRADRQTCDPLVQ
jgi:hypothetical protein